MLPYLWSLSICQGRRTFDAGLQEAFDVCEEAVFAAGDAGMNESLKFIKWRER